MLTLIISAFFWFYEPAKVWADTRVRRVQMHQDKIEKIRTAIGVATIIQVPDRPNSVIVGDVAAFKVEYLDQAITIKPLRPSAKSNLYIYTDFRRYNIQLITTYEEMVDYVVYLENPAEKIKSSAIKWKSFKNFLRNESIKIETTRSTQTPDGVLLLEFLVSSDKREKFKPEWLWLLQENSVKPINNLALSSQYIEPQKPIKGILQILKSDINEKKLLRLELRRLKTSFLTLPRANQWK